MLLDLESSDYPELDEEEATAALVEEVWLGSLKRNLLPTS